MCGEICEYTLWPDSTLISSMSPKFEPLVPKSTNLKISLAIPSSSPPDSFISFSNSERTSEILDLLYLAQGMMPTIVTITIEITIE